MIRAKVEAPLIAHVELIAPESFGHNSERPVQITARLPLDWTNLVVESLNALFTAQ
jgi:hypothetical protein